jgi:hypothetical protein
VKWHDEHERSILKCAAIARVVNFTLHFEPIRDDPLKVIVDLVFIANIIGYAVLIEVSARNLIGSCPPKESLCIID